MRERKEESVISHHYQVVIGFTVTDNQTRGTNQCQCSKLHRHWKCDEGRITAQKATILPPGNHHPSQF